MATEKKQLIIKHPDLCVGVFKIKNIAFILQALYQSNAENRLSALGVGVDSIIRLRDNAEFEKWARKILNQGRTGVKVVDHDNLISAISLKIFNIFYGRPSFIMLLVTLFSTEKEIRKKYYLLAAMVACIEYKEMDAYKKEFNDYFDKLEIDMSIKEAAALSVFIKAEGNNSLENSRFNRFKALMTSKKYKTLAKKTKSFLLGSNKKF